MQHIGFIMDGNRRWAKKLKNIASFGHDHGSDTIERVLSMVLAKNIPYVSMWALSKENISERSAAEVAYIFGLISTKMPKLVQKFLEDGIRFEVVGDISLVPDDVRNVLTDAIEVTKAGIAMTFILAFGYSGQDEIIRGVKRCLREWVNPHTLTEKEFLTYLDSGKYPSPDLIVRTGGNIRHSGYFLYQSAYSEYFFTETLWPDFSQNDLDAAVGFYDGVKRNFGK